MFSFVPFMFWELNTAVEPVDCGVAIQIVGYNRLQLASC